MVISLAMLLAALALIFYLIEVGLTVSALVDRLRQETFSDSSDADDLRALAYAVAALLGVMAAATIFFSIIKVWINERQTTATEQGQITDRINQAVQGLGAEKTGSRIGRPITVKLADSTARLTEMTGGKPHATRIHWQGQPAPYRLIEETVEDEGEWQVFSETQPNLEVRIGALYALERIMQDSERDHIQIMEILCAYIRQNAQVTDVPLPDGDPTPQEWKYWGKDGQTHLRLDVDVALRVIERRDADRKKLEDDKGYRPGLERAPLRKLVLQGRRLPKADLRGAELQGAHLRGGAQLQGANVGGAQFDGDTSLTQATLRGALVRDVDFTNLPQINDHLADVFGDASVTLPGGHGPDHPDWPGHWPKEALDYEEFEKAWRDWQKTLDDYDPDLWGVAG